MDGSGKIGKAMDPVFQEEEELSNMAFDGEEFARALDLEKSFTAAKHTKG